MKIVASLLAIALISGCAGEPYIVLNTDTPPSANYRVIDKPFYDVWERTVQNLGKQSFVIDNLDESSGLINITYSGDPEKFIDCGNITSYVNDKQGKHTYDFPGAKAEATYEIVNGGVLFYVDRKMSVEARTGLVFKVINPHQVKVTANTLYLVQKVVTAKRKDNNFTQRWSDSISFSTRGASSFRNDFNSAASTVCKPNGELERELLSAIE